MNFNFVAPCYFGLESAASFDFKRIGAQNITITDGRIAFSGGADVLAKSNIWSRCAERVMILLKTFEANTFDELFDNVTGIAWEDYLPANASFPVKGSSLSSTLSSVPACQSIVKKAIVERMKKGHKTFELPESGNEYRIRFSIRKNLAEVFLDTSGDGLHKRGYRKTSGVAPLKETLAAAMADLGRVRRDSLVQDPFCGSGTLVIESALKAMNIAPGLKRRFAAEHYAFLPRDAFKAAREEAKSEIKLDANFSGFGYDIDTSAIRLAQANAQLAGVGDVCTFKTADIKDFAPESSSIVFANPPYGERMLDLNSAAQLAKTFGEVLSENPVAGAYILTSDLEFEANFGKKARKRRKIYNGMIPCQLYMYF